MAPSAAVASSPVFAFGFDHVPSTPTPKVNLFKSAQSPQLQSNIRYLQKSLPELFQPKRPTFEHHSHVAVIGCGFVGEHLIETFADYYPVTGYDISEPRVSALRKTFEEKQMDHVTATSDERALDAAEAYLISVPTLLKSDNTIDTTYLQGAIATVSKHAQPGNVVVMESSVGVGMTRQLLAPLRARGIYCGMSPERVDPGRVQPALKEIPKVISGLDPESLEKIKTLYFEVFGQLVPVSSPEAAEMTKLYESNFLR